MAEETKAARELLKKYLLDQDWKAAENLLASSEYHDDGTNINLVYNFYLLFLKGNFTFEDLEHGKLTPLEFLIIHNKTDLIDLLLPKTSNILLRNEKKL